MPSARQVIGSLALAAVTLAGCVNEDSLTPTDPADPQNALGPAASPQTDLLSVVEMARASFSSEQADKLSRTQNRDDVREVWVAQVASDPLWLLGDGQAVSFTLPDGERHVGIAERSYAMEPVEGETVGAVSWFGSLQAKRAALA